MIRKTLFALVLLVFAGSTPASSHPGGHGPIGDEAALGFGIYVAGELANFDAGLGFGQLPASWKDLPPDAASIHLLGPGYYIIKVENADEGKSLYILMSESGEVYDANFTGAFEGLTTDN